MTETFKTLAPTVQPMRALSRHELLTVTGGAASKQKSTNTNAKNNGDSGSKSSKR